MRSRLDIKELSIAFHRHQSALIEHRFTEILGILLSRCDIPTLLITLITEGNCQSINFIPRSIFFSSQNSFLFYQKSIVDYNNESIVGFNEYISISHFAIVSSFYSVSLSLFDILCITLPFIFDTDMSVQSINTSL